MADDGGLSKFQRRMQAIPAAVRESVKPAVVASAEEVAALMRALAPEDTGALKDSIVVTGPGQTTPPYSQPGGSMTVASNAAAITVGNADVRYPHLVEYGTSFQAAAPFFWPGFRLGRKKALGRIKRAIGKAIRTGRNG